MRRIYKYPITPALSELRLPEGAKFLSLQEQQGEPQMWWLVEPDNKKVVRKIRVFGTGHELPAKPLEFLGTFQTYGGSLVFHVFEEL